MNLSKLASSAALIALTAGAPMLTMAGSASAQEAATASQMPDLLQGLDLQDMESRKGRDGEMRYEGEMADGTEIEARFDRNGKLVMIEADDGVLPAPVLEAAVPAAVRDADAFDMLAKIEELHSRGEMLGLEGEDKNGEDLRLMFDASGKLTGIAMDDAAVPQDLLNDLLPQTVRDADITRQFAVVDHVMSGRGMIMLAGQDADGQDLRAQFDTDGNLLRFGRGDDDRDGDREGGRMHGKHGDHGEHGKRGKHGDHGDRGGKHGGKGGDHARGPHDDDHGMKGGDRPDAPRLDVDAVTSTLSDAGYTDLGDIRRAGPGAAVTATNPDGEKVMLHLTPEGEVVREIAQ